MNDFEKSLGNYYSTEQLSLIQKTKIGIAGAGGLGSNIAVCLVRSGFRDFEIIDFDIVAIKNLNRQYYFLEDVGKPKVNALAERLKNINPDIIIKIERVRLGEENISSYFRDRDIIFEAFDEAGSKAWLLEQFGNDGKLLIFGSGLAGFGNQLEIKTRKIKNYIYIVGDGVTCVESDNPPLAPRVTACASLMASIAVEAILNNVV